MEAIHIPQLLKAPEKTEVIQFKEYLSGLETLTSVQGRLAVTHHGNYLEVSTVAETIVTLTCHRCLQQYNHRLAVETKEPIWLDETASNGETSPLEQEIALEDLVETLPPQGNFFPGEWLYEQMCLAMPLRQLCQQKCPGIQITTTDQSGPLIDRRWASLEVLKSGVANEPE